MLPARFTSLRLLGVTEGGMSRVMELNTTPGARSPVRNTILDDGIQDGR